MFTYKDVDGDEIYIQDERYAVEIELTGTDENYVIVHLPHKELPELIKYLQGVYDAYDKKNNTT